MLYPQSNSHRQMTDLSGFWQTRFDPDEVGRRENWQNGLTDGMPIAVPASWNDQFEQWRDYMGTAWYHTTFSLPWGWQGQRIFVRFGAVSYLAEVWLNGECLGEHEGGHLPFAFDITNFVRDEGNQLVVRVNGELLPDRVPPGSLGGKAGISFGRVDHPDTSFDFFPYSGIERPVLLYTTPQTAITDVTVVTTIDGTNGVVSVNVKRPDGDPVSVRVALKGHGADVATEQNAARESSDVTITVPNAALWSPEAPNLYGLTVELLNNGSVVDRYTLDIGIRTIAVVGDRLLLNGQSLKLVGFGRHEDFPVVGKGMLPALILKDYALMRWIGANSFRTTHYPYSEQMMQLADQLGFLVIDETPAVGLFFTDPGLERRNAVCKQFLREMIERDKNHPCVIMWSIANEPHTAKPEARQAYNRDLTVVEHPSYEAAVNTFREQAELARSLDPTRPVTLVSHEGAIEEAYQYVDVLALNRYHGWYALSGQIDVDLVHELYSKPFILSEFGTDTIPGHHAQPPEMFSEEYQAEFITKYIKLLDSKPFVVGQHIWNLCDFKTSQGVIRMGGFNFKGVFTRDRRPKLAAHRIRELWTGKTD
jgi:beta-glucuronidase